MKFSFSTKGWHDVSFEEFCNVAQDLKFEGIELHNIHGSMFSDKDGAFRDYTAAATVRRLYELKLKIPCIDAICNPGDDDGYDYSVEEISKYIEIAKNLKAPYVRVKADKNAKTENISKVISAVLSNAEKMGITLLLETTGIFADTALLHEMLHSFASDNVAALWDIHSPYF